MDQKAAYEMTIAEKLEQLSVPNMMDAIWARIEDQLDIDMPTDEGPSDPPTTPRSGGGWWISSIFIAALVSIIYFTNVKPNSNNNDQTPLPATPATINSSGTNIDRPPPPQPNVQVTAPKRPASNDSLSLSPTGDSVINQPVADVAGQPVPDSNINNPFVALPAPAINVPDTGKKKGRGVKGITDDDYRIVPAKKDSS